MLAASELVQQTNRKAEGEFTGILHFFTDFATITELVHQLGISNVRSNPFHTVL